KLGVLEKISAIERTALESIARMK
ncbi:MAG: hypothetical protein RIT24_2287, partial [Planctomycetota bacterium]